MNIKWWLIVLNLHVIHSVGCEDSTEQSYDRNRDAMDQFVSMDLASLPVDRGQSEDFEQITELGDVSSIDIDLSSSDMDVLDSELMDEAIDMQVPRDDTDLYAQLRIRQGVVSGSHSILEDGVLLDAGASIRWAIDDAQIPLGALLSISLKGQVWRVEDGRVQISSNLDQDFYQIWGNGLFEIAPVRHRYEDWNGNTYGVEALPPLLSWPISETLSYIEITSINGGLTIGDLYLHGTHAEDLAIQNESPDAVSADQNLEYISCLPAEDCDDGAGLNALIAQVTEQATGRSIDIRLPSEQYFAQSPVLINRSDLSITGTHASSPPIWKWSPYPNSGQTWPFIFRGAGSVGPALRLMSGIEYGQRNIRLNQVLDEQPTWLRLSADDFGEVPNICINGRDVERRNRHQRQLFKVLEMSSDDGHTLITLDRPIFVSIPEDATPTLTPVSLLSANQISRMNIQADCLASQSDRFAEANCQNQEVIDDGAVLSLYTDGLKMKALSATGFGKFTYEIRDSVHNVVENSQMHHPSAYGSGGQGYGVHLIGASRTVISHLEVNHARHGVVIDFGSSDSQVLNGIFSDMNQALLDVHGEASRDTLIRNNHLEQSSIGVIIGGGGRTVHCNDGPRHHVQLNRITECGIAVLVSDETEKTYVRSNHLCNNGTHVGSAYGAHDIQVERNQLGSTTIKAISVGFEGTRDMRVRRNLFQEQCSPDEALLQLNGAERPEFIDNIWCPQ